MPVLTRIQKPLARKCKVRNGIYIYCLSVQCLLAHLPEVHSFLDLHRPHVVLLQETWLDATVGEVYVPGYVTVSRRDRNVTANRGGILTLQRDDFNGLVHICDCDTEERSWHFLRLDEETLLLGN